MATKKPAPKAPSKPAKTATKPAKKSKITDDPTSDVCLLEGGIVTVGGPDVVLRTIPFPEWKKLGLVSVTFAEDDGWELGFDGEREGDPDKYASAFYDGCARGKLPYIDGDDNLIAWRSYRDG